MNPISREIRIGTVGELLVALRFLQYGVQAAPPIKDSGNDLIAVRGEVFRAVQVKTTLSPVFRLYDLPNLFHLVALVHLVGEGHSIYLDESRIFLLEKSQINRGRYRMEELNEYVMDKNLVDRLFSIEPLVEAHTIFPTQAAAQQRHAPDRGHAACQIPSKARRGG